MSENKDEKTIEKSKQEEQSIGILKRISQLSDKNKKRLEKAGIVLASLALSAVMIVTSNNMDKKNTEPVNSYTVVQPGDENVTGTDGHVKFDAFFLQNNNGIAEGIRGTCREIGKQSTLYMELNVLTEGYLKDAVITINGNNFYLATALPKDTQIKNNYVSSNTQTIELNTITNGTQKLIMGVVRSGDYTYTSGRRLAIGSNINNYSRSDNTVVLTGTYVNAQNQEIQITKTVPLTVDWYGTTQSIIHANRYSNSTYTDSLTYEDIANRIDTTNETITLDFTVYTEETANQLNIYRNHTEGTIPQLNGYDPISVTTTSTGVAFTYNAETRRFTLTRTAEVNQTTGSITKTVAVSNTYGIKVVYPLEAYQSLGSDTITIQIPVETYYEGYNNPGQEFTNPYRSNIATTTITATYRNPQGTVARVDVEVGKYLTTPTTRYVVSKQNPIKIYNGIETSGEDLYQVKWYAFTGSNGASTGFVLKETANGGTQVVDQFIKSDSTQVSMENVTTNVGIYFNNANSILGDNGEIKVYDEETNVLLATFTKDGREGSLKWDTYSNNNIYRYEYPVKHIRVETSATNASSALYVYNIKRLDDEYITSNYTRAQFDELQYIKSTLVGYLGGTYINTDTNQANYEAPISIAKISLNPRVFSTQETEYNDTITITASGNSISNQIGWVDGSFLIKLPAEILDIQINSINISNNNVTITSYEVIEKEIAGQTVKFIKINTANNSDTEQSYTITINTNITPDPRISTISRALELYASNKAGIDYYYHAVDTYDVNDNSNTTEQVNHTTASISLVSPNSLLTNQIITNYDNSGSTVVSPQTADLTPEYANIDNTEKEATIGVHIKNNYERTISEIKIIGKIPFEGNTYTLSGGSLSSTFTTKMKSTGITVPQALQSSVTVYYSSNTNPTNDLTNPSNGWTLAQNVTNWDNIRTYAIDFGNTVLSSQDEYTFYYTVKVPTGLSFNQVSYSHHGVYFSLDTQDGKYRTQTEPNKVGIRIAEKYDLKLTKYQKGKNRTITGATYSITEVKVDSETGDITYGATRTAMTNSNGELNITGLYAEQTYLIQEIKSPADYELNNNVIIFIAHVNRNTGVLTVQKVSGTTKESMTVTKAQGEDYKVNVDVEDEAKATLRIIKKVQGSNTTIQGVIYRITGDGMGTSGRRLITDSNGEVTLNEIKIGSEYTLEEIKAEGYYLADPIEFKVINNSGTYQIQIKNDQGTYVVGASIARPDIGAVALTEINDIPTATLTLTDDPIPTYNLELTKIEHVTTLDGEQNNQETTYLQGAKFRLYKDDEKIGEYVTGANGKLTITNLYQYIEGKGIDGTYVLKEILAPTGYAPVKDITFKVDGTAKYADNTEDLEFIETLTDGQTAKQYTVDGNTIKITIEDNPIFKLVKKDGETNALLSNVKFAIYNIDSVEEPARNSKGEIIGTKETINGREYYTVTTNNSGEISLDLPEGLYKAVEVQADEKYDLSKDTTYYFGIGASRKLSELAYFDYANSVGGTYQDTFKGVTATSDGGYVAVGSFDSSSITVGGHTLTNAYTSGEIFDGMIIKYSSDGEVEWASSVGGTSNDYLYGVTATSDGGCVAVGYFQSVSLTVGGYTLTRTGASGFDGMIIKYSSNGEVDWANSVGGTNYSDYLYGVTATSDGGYVAVGNFQSSTITVGGYTLTSAGGDDGMIIKYNANGTVAWASSVGGANSDQFTSVTATEDGGYVAVGYFQSSSITVGGYTLTRVNSFDGMIIKYSSNGTVLWASSVGGTDDDYLYGVTATSDGGYVAVGYFTSTSIIVGGYTLTRVNSFDGMIIKYSSNGTVLWASSVGGTRGDYLYGVTATSDGGCVAVGHFDSSSITVGSYTLTRAGTAVYNEDGMIIKYTSNGEVALASRVGGTSGDCLYGVTATSDGNYVAVGDFRSPSISDGAITLTNTNMAYIEGMIIKYKTKEIPTLYTNTAQSVGGTNNDVFTGVTATSDGGYVAVGYFNSSTITVGNYTLTRAGTSTSYGDGMIVKYNANNEVEWASSIGGTYNDQLLSVTATSDGGYVTVGYFNSSTITVGEYTLTRGGSSTSYSDGMIIKYNANNEVEWASKVGGTVNDCLYGVTATSDGGYVAVGYFASGVITVGGYKLTNAGGKDGMIIKYSSNGTVEWASSVGGTTDETFNGVTATSDGDYVVVGDFYSQSITVGGYTLTNAQLGSTDGMIIKYTSNGEVEWATSVGGTNYDYLHGVTATLDGGYVAVGYFNSPSITVGGYTLTSAGNNDGMIIKYTSNGEVEWASSVGGTDASRFNGVTAMSDEGYVAVGYFYHSSLKIGDYTLINKSSNSCSGMIIKYSSNGEVEWASSIGGGSLDELRGVTETLDGDYVAVGDFSSNNITVGSYTLTNAGTTSYTDGMIIKQALIQGASEMTELEVQNNRKEYKITTDINEIDGIKGGTISGDDSFAYETVKHGDSTTKSIVMTPDTGYEIISITVNGVDYPFTPELDDTFTMPDFTNVTEDKHVVVTYSLKNNKITINKVDSVTGDPLTGATFKLDQIEEREEPVSAIGSLTDNSADFYELDLNNEITGVLGNKTDVGTYYFTGNTEPYTSNNTGAYTQAVSYIELDLTGYTGSYQVVINAQTTVNSSQGWGYAHITTTTTTPTRTDTTGRVFHGTFSNLRTAKDYTSERLEGGQIYYIYLGCWKTYSIPEPVIINSIKVYKAKTVTYNFAEVNGKYESTNQGKPNTTSNSYIPIDLTGLTGKYNITVNAEVSSQSGYDYGYVTLSDSTTRPSQDTTTGVTRFVNISGTVSAADYTTEVDGGSIYYLHLGYCKNATTDTGNDKFTVNSVRVTPSASSLYHTEVSTNSDGQAITQIPFGKYAVTELEAPEGYLVNDSIADIEFRDTQNAVHEFTVQDEKIAKVTVHHYIKNTTTSVADDEIYNGIIGATYLTEPRTDLARYQLELDQNDEYILPANREGTFTYADIEVIYYYVPKQVRLTVHHYIEGTETPVPLLNGTTAEDVVTYGNEHANYTTSAIPDVQLSAEYELLETPANATGTYEYDEVEVIYYYGTPVRTLTVNKLDEDGVTPLPGAQFIITTTPYSGGEITVPIYTTNANGQVVVDLEIGEYYITEIEAPAHHNLPTIRTTHITISKSDANKVVNITNAKQPIQLTVHHYIEGTTTPVPLANGGTAQDVVTTGEEHEDYITYEIPAEQLDTRYELAEVPANSRGTYEYEEVVVTYYYKIKTGTLRINKVDEDDDTPLEGAVFGITENEYVSIKNWNNQINNGPTYEEEQPIELGDEIISDVQLTNYWTNDYTFEKVNNVYIPQNSSEYQLSHGGSGAITNWYANAGADIDLSSLSGRYALVINAEIVCENGSYACSGDDNGAFDMFYVDSQNVSAKDYTQILQGGNSYVLYVGFNTSSNPGSDIMRINSIKVYEVEEEERVLGDEVNINIQLGPSEYNDPYEFEQVGNQYIPGNSEEYQLEHGGSTAISGEYASSAGTIDLSELSGRYALVVNAEADCENGSGAGIGWCEGSGNGNYEWIASISGDSENAKDYIAVIDGGNIYTLYLEFCTSSDPGSDIIRVNSIKVYEVEGEDTSTRYYFEKDVAGRYVSNNGGKAETFAQTVIPIDLTDYDDEDEFTLIVNAEAQVPGGAYGVVGISDELYSGTDVQNGSINTLVVFNNSNTPSAQDYTYNLYGGNTYYLYLIYDKTNDSYNGSANDRMIVNSIRLEKYVENYIDTDEYGYAEITLPVGSYTLAEVQAPEGYKLPTNNSQTVNITKQGLTLTIENELEPGKVIVHHYIEGTTKRIKSNVGNEDVADQLLTGDIGDTYTTSPAVNKNPGYTVVSATPTGYTGSYTAGVIEVTYYYSAGNFVITTEVDGTGGSISGEGEDPYETVKAGENSTKEIIAIPDTGYYVASITVNDVPVTIIPEEDGTVILPQFVNMSEDKEVVATFSPLETVTVTKEWDDNNNSLGLRPSTVQVELIAYVTNPDTTTTSVTLDQSITTTVTLRATSGANNGDNWTYEWSGLPHWYTDGRAIEYTVEEVPLTGNLARVYTAEVEEDSVNENEFTITNTYSAPTEKVNFQVNKVWSDNNNENGKRPASLKFEIYNTGTNTKSAEYTITTASESSHVFELNKYDALGAEIAYEAREVEVIGANDKGLTFYTTTGGTTTTGTVNGDPGYIATFTNTFNVPDEKISIVANKVWSDNNNANGKRPSSIKFVLSKTIGGSTTVEANYTLNTANESSHTFSNLTKYDSHGDEITYTLTEEEVNTDDLKFYTTQISNGTTVGNTTTYTVTNTFTVPDDKISIEATKVWSDNSDRAHKRPTSVTIKLMRGNTQVATDVASSSNSWTVTFSNLAKYDSSTGAEITYTLDEAEVNTDDLKFYTLTSSTVTPPPSGTTYTGTITNTFTVPDERITVPVTKVWDDNSNANSIRPASLDLTLTGNGQTYTHRLTSSNADPTNSNNWIYTFTNIPRYDSNGDDIAYTLSETAVNSGDLNGYIGTVSGYTVTNEEILKEVSVEKTGPSIIYAKDATVSYTINYTAEVDRDFTGTSTITIVDTLPYEIDTTKAYNLDGGTYNSSAKTITWTGTYNPSTNIVTWSNNTTTTLSSQLGATNRITVQKNVSMVYDDIDLTLNNFTNEVEGRASIANGTHIETTDDITTTTYFKRNIIVNKVWNGDSTSGTRPDTVTVQAKNGNTTVQTLVVRAINSWTGTFTDLPRYDLATGNEITYTITESSVPTGYYVEIAEDLSQGAEASKTTPNDLVYTVTNNKYGSITITKVDRADNTIKLGGAEFRLYKLKEENGSWVVDNTFVPVTQITSSAQATLGETTFSNLEYGKYRLQETVAPTGYNLLRSTVDIDVTASTPDFAGNVANLHKTVLPATGGEVRVILAIAGLTMIATAIHLNNKRKMKERMK